MYKFGKRCTVTKAAKNFVCRSLSCWSKLRSSPTLQSKTTEEEKKINNLVSTTSQCRRHLDKLSSLFDLDLFTNLRGFIKHQRSENSPGQLWLSSMYGYFLF